METKKARHFLIIDLLGLNEFLISVKKRINLNNNRIKAVRYLRDLASMNPTRYKLEYRIEKSPVENYELLLLEKQSYSNKESWEVINTVTRVMDGYIYKNG
jgi:hypothetical protein